MGGRGGGGVGGRCAGTAGARWVGGAAGLWAEQVRAGVYDQLAEVSGGAGERGAGETVLVLDWQFYIEATVHI